MNIRWDQMADEGIHLAMRLGASALIYCVFHFIGRIAKGIVARVANRAENSRRYVINLMGQTIKVALMAFGAVTALGTLGINVTALVAGLGLTGFALGFALKDAVSNLLAGMMILLYQPFRIGDRIATTGFEGKVVGIDLRYTTLLAANGQKVLIPNSSLLSNVVVIVEPAP